MARDLASVATRVMYEREASFAYMRMSYRPSRRADAGMSSLHARTGMTSLSAGAGISPLSADAGVSPLGAGPGVSPLSAGADMSPLSAGAGSRCYARKNERTKESMNCSHVTE